MELSVVIPCLNAVATLGEQIEALQGQGLPGKDWEILVADNGSRDGSREFVEAARQRYGNVFLVDASARRGAAHARNVGVAHARADRILFCDADDVVGDDYIAAMWAALDEHDLVAPRFDGQRLNGERWAPHPQEEGLQPLWYPPGVPHAGGSGLGVRRRWHEAVEGFDEDLRALEDTDYCIRLQRLGVELVFVPEAVVHVRLHDSGIFKQSRSWARANQQLFRMHAPHARLEGDLWTRYLRNWRGAFRRFLRRGGLRSEAARRGLAWELGWQTGLAEGCLRYGGPPVIQSRSLGTLRAANLAGGAEA